jgi:steroid delta-isomerase
MTDGAADHAEKIRSTIRRYQTTFSDNDRAGWIGLFAEDGVLEDPVGTRPCVGHDELGEFWDTIHASGHDSYVVPVNTPAVCGLEAAWAFEVHVDAGDVEQVISIIDVGRFTEDGRIAHNRAFWDPSTVQSIPKRA